MTPTLITCPYCAGPVRLRESDTAAWVECRQCGARGPKSEIVDDAVNDWNEIAERGREDDQP